MQSVSQTSSKSPTPSLHCITCLFLTRGRRSSPDPSSSLSLVHFQLHLLLTQLVSKGAHVSALCLHDDFQQICLQVCLRLRGFHFRRGGLWLWLRLRLQLWWGFHFIRSVVFHSITMDFQMFLLLLFFNVARINGMNKCMNFTE